MIFFPAPFSLYVFVLALSLLMGGVAVAAPNEIKVFTDEITSVGETSVELHINKGSRSGPNALNRDQPLQLMPEVSYGFSKDWEISLHLPASYQNQKLRSNGQRLELQYVASHDAESGFYWGVNFELARLTRGDDAYTGIQMFPIIGWRDALWHLVLNPALSKPLTGNDKRLTFDPAMKVGYRVFGKNYFGFEYFEETGPLKKILPGDQRYRMLYLTWDGKLGKSEVNVGLGKGLTSVSDRLVLKAIVEIGF
jgi:hypothetical protein